MRYPSLTTPPFLPGVLGEVWRDFTFLRRRTVLYCLKDQTSYEGSDLEVRPSDPTTRVTKVWTLRLRVIFPSSPRT